MNRGPIAPVAALVPARLLGPTTARVYQPQGWERLDARHPLYLAGRVLKAVWTAPGSALEIALDAPLRLPPDLVRRPVPKQALAVADVPILAAAALPRRADVHWIVELAGVARLDEWRMPRPAAGERIEAVGYGFPGERGAPLLRAEFVFVAGHAYPMRSGRPR
ncbi:hypothetical protein [Caldimonas tepidiphila]|uniref:hypothetical protein n=1 Tax=Caldimonas tepidiphila TaxID=2315841 RepID=UPI000E5BE11C|nr:hypothetical protein [Caldimonas tepidiphila]